MSSFIVISRVIGSLFLPATLTLGFGVWMGVQGVRQDSETKNLTVQKSLVTDSRLLAETAWSLLEQAPGSDAAASARVPYKAEVEIQGNMLVPLSQTEVEPELAQAILKATAQVLRPELVARAGVLSFWVKPDAAAKGEWLGLVRASSKRLGQYSVSVLDPVQAFSVFKGFGDRAGAGDLRAYLITDDGRVVVHSQSAYNGSHFKDVPIYQQLVARMGSVTAAGQLAEPQSSIDRIDVLASYSRVRHLPFGVVVEKAQPPASRFWDRFSRAHALLLGAVALLWLISGWRMVRGIRSGTMATTDAVSSQQAPPVASHPPLSPQTAPSESMPIPLVAPPARAATPPAPPQKIMEIPPHIQSAMESSARNQTLISNLKSELSATQAALVQARQEEKTLARFESEAVRLRDPRIVAQRLVHVAAELSKSPALFFLYQDKIRAAVLHCDAGLGSGDSPVGMSFPLDDEMIRRIVLAQQKGEVASLADYGPLARLILARTGVAHFEAWALTGYGNLGRQAGRVRLVGVLVVLQSGVDSVASRDSLSRMLRTTGLIYENALLSI